MSGFVVGISFPLRYEEGCWVVVIFWGMLIRGGRLD